MRVGLHVDLGLSMLERRLGSLRPGNRAEAGEELVPMGTRALGASVGQASGSAEPAYPNILLILWRRRWLVLLAVVLAVAGGFIYLAKATPIFQSTSQIYVQQNNANIIGNSASPSVYGDNFIATQVELLRATPILAAAIELPQVRQAPTLAGSQNPIGLLKSLISVEPGKNNDMIYVSAKSDYPDDAALIANSVVDAYITYQSKQHQSAAAEMLKILTKEKTQRDKEFDEIQAQMIAFKRANGTLTFEDARGNIVTQRLGELSEQLTQAQLAALDAKLLKDAVEALGNDPVKIKQLMQAQYAKGIMVNVGSENSDLWADLRNMERQATRLRATRGPEDPLRQSVERAVSSMREEIQLADKQAAQNHRDVVEQQYVSATAREKELQRAFDEQRVTALELNGKAAEYSKLENDLRRSERLNDVLDSRIKEINVNEGADGIIATILEVAGRGAQIEPRPSRVIFTSLLIGLMIGAGVTWLQDRMDQRLRSVDEIGALLDLPVLGIVPHIQDKLTPLERGQEVHLKPRSDVAESYRTIRTAVYFGIPDGQAKTILVTSPSPGDGKTTMISNLAITMAQAGRRVLLIDADCRKPMQHKIYGLESDVGLASILLDHSKTDAAIQPTNVENLSVLPCGPIPTNPAELLNSQAFLDLIESLSPKFDHILIDSPPVIPVTDARILAASCDATILVLRAEKSTRKMSEFAVNSLTSVGGRLLGVVVNDVPRKKGRYGYYSAFGDYRYGYYAYGYGQMRDEKSNGNGRNGNGKHLDSDAVSVKGSRRKAIAADVTQDKSV